MNYGVFLNNVVSFLIVAFAVFLLIRAINSMKRQEEAKPAPTQRECPYCRSKIALAATRCPHCTSEVAAA